MSNALTLRSELSWLASTQSRLREIQAQDRLGHALLVHGSAGNGASWLARWMAALVLCENRSRTPCTQCRACLQVEQGQHPDFYWLEPIEDSREIRIGQVRDLMDDLSLTSHGQGWKVAVLAPADRLNRNAANALLKTLEEPAARTVLILVAAQPSRLPATIRSRCQRIDLPIPDRAAAQAWLGSQDASPATRRMLDLLHLEPLQAVTVDAESAMRSVEETLQGLQESLAGRLDVVATAERWSRSDYEWRLACIENWLTEQLRQGAAGAGASANLRAAAHLPASLPALNIRALFELLDAVRELRRLADAPLNRSLALERVLWRVPAAAGRGASGA